MVRDWGTRAQLKRLTGLGFKEQMAQFWGMRELSFMGLASILGLDGVRSWGIRAQ